MNEQTAEEIIKSMHDDFPSINTNCTNAKQSFDEIALARVYVMAHESLNPDEFESFACMYNALIDRRKLQNKILASDHI